MPSNIMLEKADRYETLCRLGLTKQQAKMYLNLAEHGRATVKELSKCTETDRGETYRVLGELQKRGLVTKILTSPTEFQVASFREGVRSLIKRRKEETAAIEKRAIELIGETKSSTVKSELTGEELIYVPRSASYAEKSIERILAVQKSVDILTDSVRYRQYQTHNDKFDAAFKKLLGKGVKIRLLIGNPSREEFPVWEHERFGKSPNFFARMTSEEVAAPMGIHDGRELEIFISKTTDISEASALVTNNARLAKIVQQYFDGLWRQAKEIPP